MRMKNIENPHPAVEVRASSQIPEDTQVLIKGVRPGEGGGLPALEAAVAQGFRGEGGTPLVLYPDARYQRVVAVGLGSDPLDAALMRHVVRVGMRHAEGQGLSRIAVDVPGLDEFPLAAALGLLEGAYTFSAYRQQKARVPRTVTLVGARADALGLAAGAAAHYTRDWVNWGANDKAPMSLAQRMQAMLEGQEISVEILSAEVLAQMGAGGILAVGQGSDNPPAMLVAQYRGAPGDERWIALVGKGITFDSGGLSLKSGEGMMRMKGDMAGAAAVIGALKALAQSGARVNVTAVACLAENMPGGHAQRPGDVIQMLDGQTVEVLNTDAEGRLVLADGVALSRQRGAAAIIDIATLTGANAQALGGVRAGYLTRHPALAHLVEEAARETGELVWPMPPDPAFRKRIDSPIADLKNVAPGRGGGMQIGGLFVGAFTGDTPWLHLDIAGLAFAEDAKEGRTAGATGYGVGLLARLAVGYFAS